MKRRNCKFQIPNSKGFGRRQAQGFTLIEILIVIVLIGILAVAVLSAINPIEQIKKARDSGRKSDAAELLNAYDRYYTTWGCYPWDTTNCDGSTTRSVPVNPNFGTSGVDEENLIEDGEMKPQFANRDSITELWVSETNSLVSVCFEPESDSARNGGLGQTMEIDNQTTAACSGAYSGGGSGATCYVCVPQ